MARHATVKHPPPGFDGAVRELTVFSELDALATRPAAPASWTGDPAQRSGLLAEADTVAELLARLRTIRFTRDPFDPATPTCPASRGGGRSGPGR
jgi:hypothetical protein